MEKLYGDRPSRPPMSDGVMTLDQAIAHALENASSLEGECAKKHLQLATWLIELKCLRRIHQR